LRRDGAQCGLGLLLVDAIAQADRDPYRSFAALHQVFASALVPYGGSAQRYPHVGGKQALDPPKVARRHSDNIERLEHKHDGLAGDIGRPAEFPLPQRVAQHHRRRAFEAGVTFHQRSSHHGTHPQHREVVFGNLFHGHHLIDTVHVEHHRVIGGGYEIGHAAPARLVIQKVRIGRSFRHVLAIAFEVEEKHLGTPLGCDRSQEHAVHHAKQRGIGTDGEGQRHHGDRRGPRILGEHPGGIAGILPEVFQPARAT
jgi:hypothetical protein